MTFPCNEVSSRTAGPLFKSCRVASPFLGLSPRSWSPSKPEFNYPYDLPFYREPPVRITARNRRRTRTFFSSIPPSRVLPIQVPAPWKMESDRKVKDCWTAYGLRFRDHETNRGWRIFALHATRSERWLAVGPAWDRALGVPLFPETSVGADKWRVGGCIVDRGPRICAGYHHPARPTDWTHFLVSKRKKTPRGEEGVERRYAAASDLQGFVQGRSEDSDSQLQER